jgi:hypothetical protein
MSEEQVGFSRYGAKFQENLTRLILEDRGFADQISEVLDIKFLDLRYLQVFVKKIFEYKTKYGTHPSIDSMSILIKDGVADENELVSTQILEFFNLCRSGDDVEGKDHIKEVSLDFCKRQKLKEAMIKSIGLINNSNYGEISKLMEEALRLGSDNNFGYDYLVDFERRFQVKARNPVTTGWKTVDDICRGGLGNGELGVVVAPTGAGKSMALVHLGAQAVKAGKTVVHYTLELQDTVVAIRYDSCITGIKLNKIFSNKEQVYDIVSQVPGKLIVKEYPTKTASTNTIKTHLETLRRRNIDVDMVIVDYGDLLRPVSALREKRNELESIYEELRAIAQINECPVWTASQTNRSGLNAEVITMESISEAFNKCFVADFIFTISRTIEDKANNEGRIFIAKNRNGADGLVYPIFMDTSNVKIDVLTQAPLTIGSVVMKTAKEQQQSLKDKYKSFRND